MFSHIRTITVGFGITPNLLTPPLPTGARGLARRSALTAGGESHPAPRTLGRFYGMERKDATANGGSCSPGPPLPEA